MSILNNKLALGVGIAAATAALLPVLAPTLLPALAGSARPLAKTLLRGGLLLYEKSREMVAVAGEMAEDLIAEIRADEALRKAAGESPAGEQPAAVAEGVAEGIAEAAAEAAASAAVYNGSGAPS